MLALNVLKEKQCRQSTSSVETACYFPIKKITTFCRPLLLSSLSSRHQPQQSLYLVSVYIHSWLLFVFINVKNTISSLLFLSLSLDAPCSYSPSVKQSSRIHEMNIAGIINEKQWERALFPCVCIYALDKYCTTIDLFFCIISQKINCTYEYTRYIHSGNRLSLSKYIDFGHN